MTKADIVNEIAEATGLTKTDTSLVVEEMLASISNALAKGKNIEIRGFGRFKVKRRAPRTARNPRTGEAVPIPTRNVPVWEPSDELKGRVGRIRRRLS
ncbi:MAG: HU family DNA-binding protein [bacterium]